MINDANISDLVEDILPELIRFIEVNEITALRLKKTWPSILHLLRSLYNLKVNERMEDNIMKINYKDGSMKEISLFENQNSK